MSEVPIHEDPLPETRGGGITYRFSEVAGIRDFDAATMNAILSHVLPIAARIDRFTAIIEKRLQMGQSLQDLVTKGL